MKISHHPDDSTVVAYAAGALTEGFSLVQVYLVTNTVTFSEPGSGEPQSRGKHERTLYLPYCHRSATAILRYTYQLHKFGTCGHFRPSKKGVFGKMKPWLKFTHSDIEPLKIRSLDGAKRNPGSACFASLHPGT